MTQLTAPYLDFIRQTLKDLPAAACHAAARTGVIVQAQLRSDGSDPLFGEVKLANLDDDFGERSRFTPGE